MADRTRRHARLGALVLLGGHTAAGIASAGASPFVALAVGGVVGILAGWLAIRGIEWAVNP